MKGRNTLPQHTHSLNFNPSSTTSKNTFRSPSHEPPQCLPLSSVILSLHASFQVERKQSLSWWTFSQHGFRTYFPFCLRFIPRASLSPRFLLLISKWQTNSVLLPPSHLSLNSQLHSQLQQFHCSGQSCQTQSSHSPLRNHSLLRCSHLQSNLFARLSDSKT